MNWRALPFIRFILPLILGITLSEKVAIHHFSMNYLLLLSFISLLFFNRRLNTYSRRWISGLAINAFLFLLGYQITYYQNDTRRAQHFYSEIAEENYLIGIVQNEPNLKKGKIKVEISTQSISPITERNVKTCEGVLLVYLNNYEGAPTVKYGDQVLIKSKISPIQKAKNPNAFDYSKYLYFKNIHFQSFVYQQNWKILKSNQRGVFWTTVYSVRNHYLKVLEKHIKSDKEVAIASALILGYKDKLSQELKVAYAESGAIHVLAVSGLHVGIISEFLLFLLTLLPFKGRSWNWTKLSITLIGVWLFALLAGMPPSVQRAAIMFSALNFGLVIQRDVNPYNTLAIAAFLILVTNPYALFDVGFQFSFLAVLGILFFVKRFRKIWVPKNKYLDKVWTLTLVGVSAQLAVFPLILYYFHQVPLYFWLAGLFVIPLAGVLLKAGIILLILSHIDGFLAGLVGQLIASIIYYQNLAINFIQSLPFHVLSGIWINQIEVLFFYGVVAGLALWLFTYNKHWAMMSLGAIFVISCMQVRQTNQENKQQQIVIYSINKKTAIDFIDGRTIYALISEELSENEEIYTTQNNRWSVGSKKVIPIVGEEMKKSNFMKKIKKWKVTCDKMNLEYHDVKNNGAYVIDISSTNRKVNKPIPKSSLHKHMSELHLDY